MIQPTPVKMKYVVDAYINGRWHRITSPMHHEVCEDIIAARMYLKLAGSSYQIVPPYEAVRIEKANGDHAVGLSTTHPKKNSYHKTSIVQEGHNVK